MRRSRKFSNRKKNDDILLYVMCIIALIQIFYLVVRKKYTSLLFFCIVGILLNLFIKNVSIVLIIDILVTNILMRTVIKREGLTGSQKTQIKDEKEQDNADNKDGATTTTPTTTPATTDATTVTKPEGFESIDKGISTPASVSNPGVLTDSDKKLKGVNKSIQMLSNLMDKFSSISGQLNYN